MHKSGETIVLKAGAYQAKIVTVGAGIAELTQCGKHLVLPHLPEEMPLAHLGKVLVPWPNRITGGRYAFQGKSYLPAINDRVANAAIHGLLAWHNWTVSERSPSAVTLTAFLPPGYGYPFMLVSEVSYRLDGNTGLSARISSQNIGEDTAPYGAGVHPYLTCNLQRVDECELCLPEGHIFHVDALDYQDPHLAGLDFRHPTQINSTGIDHTFKPVPDDAPWEVKLTDTRHSMSTWLRSNAPWLQVYSGEKLNRLGLAVEPMSCPPDAFNSTIDLISLSPGETHHLQYSIGGEK